MIIDPHEKRPECVPGSENCYGRPLFTIGSLAAFLGIARSTLYQLLRNGEVPPYVRVGRQIRFRPEDVDVYVEARLEQGSPRTLFTINSLAEYLVISRARVYELVNAGEIATVRVGHRIRFRPEDVDAFLEERRNQ